MPELDDTETRTLAHARAVTYPDAPGYVDAGAGWVCPMDYLPIVLDPSEPRLSSRDRSRLLMVKHVERQHD